MTYQAPLNAVGIQAEMLTTSSMLPGVEPMTPPTSSCYVSGTTNKRLKPKQKQTDPAGLNGIQARNIQE